jgi:5-methylthioadenosine/S-adenosylhomocysteine deaminase
MSQILRGGTIVTHGDGAHPYQGIAADIHIHNGSISALPPIDSAVDGADVVDVSGLWLVPGFVQAHTHLVQTLFRGMADDLALLPWLRTRIWPLEAAHDPESTYWSARLGLTEMLLGGTTAILDMASIRHTDAIFQAAEECGIRAHIGKAMMDRENEAGLSEPTETSIRTSCDTRDRWHKKGRLRYAFAPRFVPSCSEELLRLTLSEARTSGCLIHTHASENLDEASLVRELTGMDNVVYLDSLGMTGPDVVLAHCIHLTDIERALLARTKTAIAHCPSSNFKLASGTAPTPELLADGSVVVIGSDGAPCNNRMDIFAEMRLAALMQKPRLGAESIRADQVLDMATRTGAHVLGTGGGDLKIGSAADIVAIDPNAIHSLGGGPAAGCLVYSATPSNVRHVWIGGDHIVDNGRLGCWSIEETVTGCQAALGRVRSRATL